jgi:hypothetical protein
MNNLEILKVLLLTGWTALTIRGSVFYLKTDWMIQDILGNRRVQPFRLIRQTPILLIMGWAFGIIRLSPRRTTESVLRMIEGTTSLLTLTADQAKQLRTIPSRIK